MCHASRLWSSLTQQNFARLCDSVPINARTRRSRAPSGTRTSNQPCPVPARSGASTRLSARSRGLPCLRLRCTTNLAAALVPVIPHESLVYLPDLSRGDSRPS